MTEPWVRAALGRAESPARYDVSLLPRRILITGANGSIGRGLAQRMAPRAEVMETDVDDLDVSERSSAATIAKLRPDLIMHMAGAKHAPAGEEDPYRPFQVHVEGTRNVLLGAEEVGAHVVVASTCKACDPETAYGASKLIAERLALNSGHTVVRYYNVIETHGNVFEIWRGLVERGETLTVTPCERRFMSYDEALSLAMWAATRRTTGRFMHWPTILRSMRDVLNDVWPLAVSREIPPRRGDRMAEPEHATCESAHLVDDSVVLVVNPHDV